MCRRGFLLGLNYIPFEFISELCWGGGGDKVIRHQLSVLASMHHEGHQLIVSHGRLNEWEDFTFGSWKPPPVVEPVEDEAESAPVAVGEPEEQLIADMIYESPWLKDRWAEQEQLDDGMSEDEYMGLASKKKRDIVVDEDRREAHGARRRGDRPTRVF